MASAALVPVMRSLAPYVRRYGPKVVKGAFNMWRRNRSARVARGKWYFGRRISRRVAPSTRRTMRQVGSAVGAASVTAVKRSVAIVRNDVGKVGIGVGETCGDSELCSVNIATHADPTTVSPYVLALSPMSVAPWPKLANKAPNFTEYDCMGLVVTATPMLGTSFNGKVYMGFTPQSIDDPTSYGIPDDIVGLPIHVDDAISKGVSLTIPPSAMSQNGAKLMMPVQNAAIGETTRYYIGNLIIGTSGCSNSAGTASDNVACIQLDFAYKFYLRKPALDAAASTATVDITNVDDMAILESGRGLSILLTDAGATIHYSCLRPHWLMVTSSHSAVFAIDEDGVALVNTAHYERADSARDIWFYARPRTRGDHTVTFTVTSGNLYRFHVLTAVGLLDES